MALSGVVRGGVTVLASAWMLKQVSKSTRRAYKRR